MKNRNVQCSSKAAISQKYPNSDASKAPCGAGLCFSQTLVPDAVLALHLMYHGADRMHPDADRSCPDADRRCLVYKVGAESGSASHAPPSQLSPGGDRADIWGEGLPSCNSNKHSQIWGEGEEKSFASADSQFDLEL